MLHLSRVFGDERWTQVSLESRMSLANLQHRVTKHFLDKMNEDEVLDELVADTLDDFSMHKPLADYLMEQWHSTPFVVADYLVYVLTLIKIREWCNQKMSDKSPHDVSPSIRAMSQLLRTLRELSSLI